MRHVGALACVSAAAIFAATDAAATPFRLEYTITDIGGGLYDYEFSLILDNNDGSWEMGQSFRWFVFGDTPTQGGSPLDDFAGDLGDVPIGPYTGYGFTSGGHNGPDLQSVVTDYVPTAIGDTLTWSGTSSNFVEQGEMLWSNVIGGSTNPGVQANFEVAYLVPSPGALPALALVGLFGRRRRRG